jgi:hypothetical protein
MAWTTGPRGIFPTLPPSDRLPEQAREIARDFESYVAQARTLEQKAREKTAEREKIIADYERRIGEAMLEGKKTPISPLPDHDAAIADLRHRAGGALRAASDRYGALGDVLVAGKAENVAEQSKVVADRVAVCIEAADGLRTLLDDLAAEISILRWLQSLQARQATQYTTATQEGSVFENATGQVGSALRRLRAELQPEPEQVVA